MKKNNLKSKTIGMTLKSLAFALGLVATTNTTSFAMPVVEETKQESHDHNHNHEHNIEKENNIVITNNNINEPKEYSIIAIKEIKNTYIANYKGCSIVEALNLCNIDSSFSNRKAIATSLGIKNYRGTSAQNIQLLNMLKNNQIDTLAKVSDIKDVCKDLFGKDAKNIIDKLNLPKTTNITKTEFARIIRQIATYKNVDTSTYDNKLGLVLNVINDINLNSQNANDIAWAYYMGYTDLDENLNYNGNKNLSVSELNYWINSFVNDYNTSIANLNINDNGLVLVPSQDKYDRDMLDNSKINSIRNPKINNSNDNIPNKGSNNNSGHNDKKPEQHRHNFNGWQYYNENNEISTCNGCSEIRYRAHSLEQIEKSYLSNNNGTHSVTEHAYCNTCDREIVKNYNGNCNLSAWDYDRTTGLEKSECNFCGYEQTREHIHGQAPADLVYTFDQSNNNGTHKLKATYECGVCEEEIILYKDENCDLGNWEYNRETGKEERDCGVCGYEETRSHEHEQAPADLVYTFDQSNNNGTHKLKATYECGVCEEEIILYKDVDCEYGACQVEINPTVGVHNELQICNDCGYEKRVQVNCTPDGDMYYYNLDSIDPREREKCLICTDLCVDIPHVHNTSGNYEQINGDDVNHKTTCICGHGFDVAHNYGDWNDTGDGTKTRECNECGYVQTLVHVHELTNTFIKDSSTEECHYIVKKCTVDGCDYEEPPISQSHNYIFDGEDPISERYKCDDCGYIDYRYKDSDISLLVPNDNIYLSNKELEVEEKAKKLILM